MTAVDIGQADQVTKTSLPLTRLTKLGAAGTGVALLLVASAYLLATGIAGPLVVTGAGEITLGNVIGFTIFGSTIGVALAYAIGRFTRKPRFTFTAVALIALAGYAVVPFTAAESVETATWLSILHLVVATPVIGMFSRYLPRDRTSVEA